MPGEDDAVSVLRIGTAAEDLARLYPWLEAASADQALPKDLTYGMQVALEEAVMNVAMHAYGPEGSGEIMVALKASPDTAALVVEDSGPPFDPVTAASPQRAPTLAETEPGGLGLTLLRHYCKDISYERADDRNRLILRFPRPAHPEQSRVDIN